MLLQIVHTEKYVSAAQLWKMSVREVSKKLSQLLRYRTHMSRVDAEGFTRLNDILCFVHYEREDVINALQTSSGRQGRRFQMCQEPDGNHRVKALYVYEQGDQIRRPSRSRTARGSKVATEAE